MESELTTMFLTLSHHFSQLKVASREEIELAVNEEVNRLDKKTRTEMERWLGGELAKILVGSIVGEPLSIYSPDLTARKNYLGEIFYHPRNHVYPIEDLERAFRRLAEIRAPQVLPKMEEVTTDLLARAGYRLSRCQDKEKPTRHKQMKVVKNGHSLALFLIPSITLVPEYSTLPPRKAEPVMVVPSERTPAPFIDFSRHHLDSLDREDIQVWVVDLTREVINPFLGSPKDKEITGVCGNPEQALLAARILRSRKIS